MNDFDLWNILKQKIDARKNSYAPYAKEGDVWMTSLGQNIGYEENGKGSDFSRPIIIIKKFNTHMVWAVPLTTKQKLLWHYFNFIDPLGQPGALILSQLRLISTKRFKRKLYTLQKHHFRFVRSMLKKHL